MNRVPQRRSSRNLYLVQQMPEPRKLTTIPRLALGLQMAAITFGNYVIEDGLVTKRDITTGISSEDYVEVIDGIKEGEEVISDLGDYTEGMEVQAVSEQTGEDADE